MHVKIGLLTAIFVSAATIVWAEPRPDDSQLARRVEAALQKCDWTVRISNGGPKGLMLLHQAKMRRVLDELQAGRSVDPNEFARVMRGHAS